MPLAEMTLTKLHECGLGIVDDMVMHELQRCIEDMQQRMGNKKERRVKMDIILLPDPDDQGIVRDTILTFHVSSSIPKGATRGTHFKIGEKGKLLTNAASPDNVNQTTLNDLPGAAK